VIAWFYRTLRNAAIDHHRRHKTASKALEVAVKDYAIEAGISASNAAVRVFRAREALRNQVKRSCGTCAEHGGLDCSCGAASGPG